MDWVTSGNSLPALVNIVHPRPTTWDIIYGGIRRAIGRDMPEVPYSEWLTKLEERALDAGDEDVITLVSVVLYI